MFVKNPIFLSIYYRMLPFTYIISRLALCPTLRRSLYGYLLYEYNDVHYIGTLVRHKLNIYTDQDVDIVLQSPALVATR